MKNNNPSIHVLGLMSGTSLDGLDICSCSFALHENKWNYTIHNAETIPYTKEFREILQNAEKLDVLSFLLLNNTLGAYYSEEINKFCQKHSIQPELVASHGQTIFHQTDKNFTYQLGSGAVIAAKTGITTVSDFRSMDVALNGQGAPLVPIGDELLFSDYDYCLNIGGFANISTNRNGSRIAWDICPANIILNKLVNSIQLDFDNNGNIARKGTKNEELFKDLNNLPFFEQKPPKSLGKEWLDSTFIPVLNKKTVSLEDKLATICHVIAFQIAQSVEGNKKTILITGGGAYNSYLVELIEIYSKCKIVIPDKEIIDFKEALVFAFLGTLCINKQVNSLRSVTGATRNSIGGTINYGNIN